MPRPTLPPDVVGILKIVGKFRECAWQGKYRSAQRYHAQVQIPKTPGLESTTGLPASINLSGTVLGRRLSSIIIELFLAEPYHVVEACRAEPSFAAD